MENIIKVFIADDNYDFLVTLKKYLNEDKEIEVVGEATDGEEAYQKIVQLKPDICLLDVIMPHLDGIAVLEKLNNSKLDTIPICIMVSAVGQDKITQEAISLGAEYYIVKPWAETKDCYWNISGRPYIYNNPLLWENLYQANKNEMPKPEDPNLILPGMKMKIPSITGEYRSGVYDSKKSYDAYGE